MTSFELASERSPRPRASRALAPSRGRGLLVSIAAAVAAFTVCPRDVLAQEGSVAAARSAPLEPGDRIRIEVWREPELSGEFRVDAGGSVVVPRLGTYQVARIPADSLITRLAAEYARFLPHDAVEVTPLRRVTVLGEVRNPGVVFVEPEMTLVDVLAEAGGISPEGKRNSVILLRDGQTLEIDLADFRGVRATALMSGDQLLVPQRSWFSRNSAFVGSVLTSAAIILAALIAP